jgi:peptidylprolyl isomerase
MKQAQYGDTVKIHYTGMLEDGSIIGTTHDHTPLEIKLGEREILPGIEEATVGMVQRESKVVNVPTDKAFGPRKEELIFTLDRGKLPSHFQPQVGQQLNISRKGDEHFNAQVIVLDVRESYITVDANHPLAGKNLIIDLELVEIK